METWPGGWRRQSGCGIWAELLISVPWTKGNGVAVERGDESPRALGHLGALR